MIALELIDVKDFMNKLLCTELMDHFLLPEATIATCVTHAIDGRMNPEYFDPGAPDSPSQLAICPFSLLRPVCLGLIRGKRAPLSFKFVFQLSPENQSRTIQRSGCPFSDEDVTGMFLNLRFQGKKLTCTTGISYRAFSLDRSLEQEWDRLVKVFLKSHQIPFTEL